MLSLRSLVTLSATTWMSGSEIGKSRMCPFCRSSSRSEKISTYRRRRRFPSGTRCLHHAAGDIGVAAAALGVGDEGVDLVLERALLLLAVLGRSSKVALAMMSFSLKLPLSMRAIAIESPLSSVPSR